MKLSKSKLALAKAINENGGWVDDSVYAANDECGIICGYLSKPIRRKTTSYHWIGSQRETWIRGIKTPQWHQCVLSREEYYQAYPKADDGWIEWCGGMKSPVEAGVFVDVKTKDGSEHYYQLLGDACWHNNWGDANIIAYRLNKPEVKPEVKPELCESVMRSIPEPEAEGVQSRLDDALAIVKVAAPHLLNEKYKFDGDEVMGERKPSIEQLAADYRNAKDYAERKQQEAYAAKADADEKLMALELAGEALGLLVSPITEKQEPDLAAVVKVGDEVECVESNIERDKYNGMVGRLHTIDESDTYTPYLVDFGGNAKIWCHEVKFISRP